MRGLVLHAWLACLAAVGHTNALPLESEERDDTQDVIPYGTPLPIFGDKFENLEILSDPISLPLSDGSLALSCIDCKASALVIVNVTLEQDTNITDSVFNVAFYDTKAHIELGLLAQGSGKAFLPIWTSGFSSDPNDILGAGLELGIALEFEADIDVRAGFDIVIPRGTYFNFIPSGGFQDTNLDMSHDIFKLIPLHVESGSATFKAALQARVYLGVDIDTPIADASAQIGAYLNLPEIVYNVHSAGTCGLEVTTSANIGFGIWAQGDVSLGWEDDDDDDVQEDDAKTLAVSFAIEGTATDCLVDQPTSFMVGGAPPPTAESPQSPTSFKVGGAPPITLSATTTTTKPMTTVPGTFVTGYPEVTASASSSNHDPLISPGTRVVTAPASRYTTSTVYTTMVHTVISCAASVTNCPANSGQSVLVTDVVELYTTVCPVTEPEAVPTHIASAPVNVDVPDKDEPLVSPASQPHVLGGASPTYVENGNSNVTFHSKEATLTQGSYQNTNAPSAVPVTAGVHGHKEASRLCSILAILGFLIAL
ncbi:extracellular serine-threonine rich protein [Fusarium sporotrichioides]|uniref:Extracellular serine-threonine rich protein n=1 Tax=Fusarium sporotrichioides TaxID=5514 RepID=A0A395RHE1_FUSSP|nr:extracellular serine-threonine rich protein [Fusarium sporotrichioides]